MLTRGVAGWEPMLPAADAAAVLGISVRRLGELARQGILQPEGPDFPGARRYPVAQIEAVLNGGGPPPSRPGSRRFYRCIHCPCGGHHSDHHLRQLRALHETLTSHPTATVNCAIDYRHGHPCLLACGAGGAGVTVEALAGPPRWRYAWEGGSHPAADLPGAAGAVITTLRSQRGQHTQAAGNR